MPVRRPRPPAIEGQPAGGQQPTAAPAGEYQAPPAEGQYQAPPATGYTAPQTSPTQGDLR